MMHKYLFKSYPFSIHPLSVIIDRHTVRTPLSVTVQYVLMPLRSKLRTYGDRPSHLGPSIGSVPFGPCIPAHPDWAAQVARRSSCSARPLGDQLHPTCSALSVIIRAVGIDGFKWDGPNRHVTGTYL